MIAVNDDFKITGTLFESSQTIVYKARRLKDDQRVIIKTSSNDYLSFQEKSRIRFEYDVLSRLKIPNVIEVYDLGEFNNNPALILEDCDAVSLSELTSAPFSLEDFFKIAIPIAKTLGEIHRHDIIHKDINPGNILINTNNKEIKIIDFNNSTDLKNEKQDINAVYQFAGSMAYISPEQTGRINRDLDYRTDYYSFGVTCFELLTGTIPFEVQDLMGSIHCHISKPVPDLQLINPAIPRPLASIVNKLMSKNAEERYLSAHGLVKDLERCRQQLLEKGAIDEFPLGEYDTPEQFHIPKKLFGREVEVKTLLRAFDQIVEGDSKLLLVAGLPGIGKTSLVNEVQKPIIEKKGYFISGKFDQFAHKIPYSAFIQAFKALVKQLLYESDSQLEIWKEKLRTALGVNTGLIVEFVPEFETIVGTTPPPPQLDSKESKIRFHNAITDLIKVFSEKNHPLVIFLDDLQWGDFAALDFMFHLVKSNISHFMLIGAYRDNEINPAHPFQVVLNDIRKEWQHSTKELETVTLAPLGHSTIREMIGEIFHHKLDAIDQLTDLLYQETEGNPFFTIEWLIILSQNGSFQFRSDTSGWDCDLKKIDERMAEKDVIAFLINQIRQLPPDTQEVLMTSSYIGNTFDLGTLALICNKTLLELENILRTAVKKGILQPYIEEHEKLIKRDSKGTRHQSLPRYRFQHDRFQQAVYSLLDDKERPAIHLEIGRVLLSQSHLDKDDQGIFDIVNHLNQGSTLIQEKTELKQLVNLNQQAGLAAQQSAAYANAVIYYQEAISLIKQRHVTIEDEKLFRISKEHTNSIYLAGEVDKGVKYCDDLLKQAKRKTDKASVYSFKARMLDHQARLLESIDAIRDGLKLLDINLPTERKEIDKNLGSAIGSFQGHLARISIEELVNLPEMENEEKIEAMKL